MIQNIVHELQSAWGTKTKAKQDSQNNPLLRLSQRGSPVDTGDWAGSVQILRRVDVCEVPVIVLNDVKPFVEIVDDVESFLPDKTDRI